jgi:hypothetical protein
MVTLPYRASPPSTTGLRKPACSTAERGAEWFQAPSVGEYDGLKVDCVPLRDAGRLSLMLRRVLATIARALDLARLFNLPDWHPDRRIGDGLNIEGDDDAVEQHSYQRTFCREGIVLAPLGLRRVFASARSISSSRRRPIAAISAFASRKTYSTPSPHLRDHTRRVPLGRRAAGIRALEQVAEPIGPVLLA